MADREFVTNVLSALLALIEEKFDLAQKLAAEEEETDRLNALVESLKAARSAAVSDFLRACEERDRLKSLLGYRDETIRALEEQIRCRAWRVVGGEQIARERERWEEIERIATAVVDDVDDWDYPLLQFNRTLIERLRDALLKEVAEGTTKQE